MSEILDLFVPLAGLDEPLENHVARSIGRPHAAIGRLRVLRRSLDARKGGGVGYRVRVEVSRPGEASPPDAGVRPARSWPRGTPPPRVVIVGSGPAGAWCALRLAAAGVPSTVLERGKPVQPRRRDLARLQRGALDPESNYCFGEGGAGTYSDGKLYTRSKDRAGVAAVLAELVAFGAPDSITVDARPHVGSNLLPRVLGGLRAHLEGRGVTYAFGAEFVGLAVDRGHVRAVRTRDGGEFPADLVVLATGHSARSVYAWAGAAGLAIARKDMAIGVRMEHPQPLVDRMQYGSAAGHPRLPPAFYQLRAEAGARTVHSFCMCPGGFIVPAATEQDGVVVNGMSLSKRDSRFANAGVVVTVQASDYGSAATGALAGVELQRGIERAAFALGGGGFRAPAQRLLDFLASRESTSLPATSYHPGVAPAALDRVLPAFLTAALRRGLAALVARFPALAHPDAVLVAAETRTSAPVQFLRHAGTLESPSLAGLYPAGEGAGHAGGIVSAALDGARVAEAILARALLR